jgi:hypothetical protein
VRFREPCRDDWRETTNSSGGCGSRYARRFLWLPAAEFQAMGAGKKAGACPGEAQSTAEAVFSEKLKCAVYVHSDVPLDALGRNADFGMRVMLVDSYGEREGGSAR